MEGGVIAIKLIFSMAHLHTNSSFLCSCGPHMLYSLLIHKQTYVNTSSACAQAQHWCQLDLPLSLCSSRLWSSSVFFFSHYLVSAEKPRAIYLPLRLSVCIHPDLYAEYFSHHLLLCFGCKASKYLRLYNAQCMYIFHTISKTSCIKQLQS